MFLSKTRYMLKPLPHAFFDQSYLQRRIPPIFYLQCLSPLTSHLSLSHSLTSHSLTSHPLTFLTLF